MNYRSIHADDPFWRSFGCEQAHTGPRAPDGWKYWPWPKGNGPLTNPVKAPNPIQAPK